MTIFVQSRIIFFVDHQIVDLNGFITLFGRIKIVAIELL